MKKPPGLFDLWQSEKGLSAMLVFLCLAIFVGTPLLAAGAVGETLFDVLFGLLLVSGVVTIGRRRLLTIAATALTLAALVLRWASFARPDSAAGIWSDALSIVLLALLASLVLYRVLGEGEVTGYRIQGAIVVYLLMGLMWSAAYQLVHGLVPSAFNLGPGASSGRAVTSALVYYSFITLTSTGYGDITPLHPVARSLAISEALTGQLYLAILIARLVSLEITSRQKGSRS